MKGMSLVRAGGLGFVLLSALLFSGPVWAQPAYEPGELLIKFRPEARGMERLGMLSRIHAVPIGTLDFIGWDHVKLVDMTVAEALDRLRGDSLVEYAEPNYRIELLAVPNDPMFPQQWALRNTGQSGGTPGADIDAVPAWDFLSGSPNVLVGVIDTGIDYNHPDLVAVICQTS